MTQQELVSREKKQLRFSLNVKAPGSKTSMGGEGWEEDYNTTLLLYYFYYLQLLIWILTHTLDIYSLWKGLATHYHCTTGWLYTFKWQGKGLLKILQYKAICFLYVLIMHRFPPIPSPRFHLKKLRFKFKPNLEVQAWGSSEHVALCDYAGCVPVKGTLTAYFSSIFPVHSCAFQKYLFPKQLQVSLQQSKFTCKISHCHLGILSTPNCSKRTKQVALSVASLCQHILGIIPLYVSPLVQNWGSRNKEQRENHVSLSKQHLNSQYSLGQHFRSLISSVLLSVCLQNCHGPMMYTYYTMCMHGFTPEKHFHLQVLFSHLFS